jgi:beta-galactosidase
MNSRLITVAGRRRNITALICIVLATAFSTAQSQSSISASAVPAPPPLLLGAAWYPEQWPESQWNSDLEMMQKAHMHLVRLGEFAWSRIEPREGEYDLDWMERAINLAGQHGIYVVIGTPSCAPPAWLKEKYPEVLLTKEDGSRTTAGVVQNFNWDNETYRRLVRLVDAQLAKKFGRNP